MDVTKETFEASLAALDDTIGDKNFAFWSLDLEFTGLNADRTTKFDVFDGTRPPTAATAGVRRKRHR